MVDAKVDLGGKNHELMRLPILFMFVFDNLFSPITGCLGKLMGDAVFNLLQKWIKELTFIRNMSARCWIRGALLQDLVNWMNTPPVLRNCETK